MGTVDSRFGLGAPSAAALPAQRPRRMGLGTDCDIGSRRMGGGVLRSLTQWRPCVPVQVLAAKPVDSIRFHSSIITAYAETPP